MSESKKIDEFGAGFSTATLLGLALFMVVMAILTFSDKNSSKKEIEYHEYKLAKIAFENDKDVGKDYHAALEDGKINRFEYQDLFEKYKQCNPLSRGIK